MGETAASAERPQAARLWVAPVVVLVVALLLGWALMGIGARRIRHAEEIRKAAESRLQIALDFAAQQASDQAKAVDDALLRSNWGDAAMKLGQVDAAVTLMEQVAPDSKRDAVRRVRDALSQVRDAVTQQSPDWRTQLDALRAALDDLSQET